MKKKVLFISLAVIVFAAIVAMIAFVLSGNDDPGNEPYAFNISGTWAVVANVDNGSPLFIDGQFMTFSADSASSYKDGSKEPFVTSSYTIVGNTLKLSDISREYTFTVDTQNYIRLYESPTKWMILVRYPNSDLSDVELTSILGKWNVLYKANGPTSDFLEFTENTLCYYSNGATDPSVTSPYSWNNGSIFADKLNKEFQCHVVSESVIVFIEKDTGYVWELEVKK